MTKPAPLPAADAFDLKTAMGSLACTHSALRRAARRLSNLYDDALSPAGLKSTQLSLLVHIEALHEPALQDLAQAMALGVSSLTYALRPLVRDGLVALIPDANDKRTKHAAVTGLGREKMAQGVALWSAANRRTDKVLGPDAALVLRTLADQVSSDAFLTAYEAGSAAR
jgi:DNA-binding MarR family transcriptional regulator